ncbi:type 4a pilus biogenesis protein PilO [Candidatus Falkowbacteria bacterium]|nr:type 4a pilus biogenesis protein PilO [Candidatus Falkowbacteria bacterium]
MDKIKNNDYVMREERAILFYLHRYLYWLLLLTLTVLVLIFYFFIISPQLSKSDVLSYFNYKNEVEQLDYLKHQKNEVENIINDFDQFSQTDLGLLEQILPSQEAIPDLIVQLDHFTTESGLILSSFSVNQELPVRERSGAGAPASGLEIKKLDISLHLMGGSYQQLKQFVHLLETNMRLMDITSFGFSAEPGRGFVVNVVTYFYT